MPGWRFHMTDLPNLLPNPRGKTRRASFLLAIVAIFSVCPAAADAQNWPSHAVKVIVPYGPGGITDTIVRLVADRLSKALNEAFVVENRPGAGGAIGTEVAARAPKDGYTDLHRWRRADHHLAADAETELRSVRRSGAGRHDRHQRHGLHGPSRPAGTVARRLHRLCAVASRRGQLFGRRHRHLEPSGAELVAAREGLKMVAVPYGHAADHHGAAQQNSRHVLRQYLRRHRADPQRQTPTAGDIDGNPLAAISDIPTVAETVPGFSP